MDKNNQKQSVRISKKKCVKTLINSQLNKCVCNYKFTYKTIIE